MAVNVPPSTDPIFIYSKVIASVEKVRKSWGGGGGGGVIVIKNYSRSQIYD